jgi:hypothetical protein
MITASRRPGRPMLIQSRCLVQVKHKDRLQSWQSLSLLVRTSLTAALGHQMGGDRKTMNEVP